MSELMYQEPSPGTYVGTGKSHIYAVHYQWSNWILRVFRAVPTPGKAVPGDMVSETRHGSRRMAVRVAQAYEDLEAEYRFPKRTQVRRDTAAIYDARTRR